jgi:DNA-binding NarL/FixJ family response regulator
VDRDREILRIWHVDDNYDDQVLFSLAISRTCPHCALQQIRHPAQAFRKFDVVPSEERPHVIVTDCSFHNMDGPAFIKEVRSRFPQIPVISLSGRTDSDMIARCYQAGVSAYFVKPVDFHELVSTVAVITRSALRQN